ncbi:hypothetical protein BaRGS_00038825 [Batillaria attramentaria]|uniref:Uncharacterized protein n=1 Tax=Batillaria attramentaria TaxID=370345 RepID=A0ABD0J5Q1_9CAEN
MALDHKSMRHVQMKIRPDQQISMANASSQLTRHVHTIVDSSHINKRILELLLVSHVQRQAFRWMRAFRLPPPLQGEIHAYMCISKTGRKH